MFNPTYLTERLGEKGRPLILKYLQPVSANAVLEQMSETYREYLDGIDLNTFPPEAKLKEFRGAVRQAEEQEAYLQGNIDSFEVEEIEAFTSVDVMRRAGLNVEMVTVFFSTFNFSSI